MKAEKEDGGEDQAGRYEEVIYGFKFGAVHGAREPRSRRQSGASSAKLTLAEDLAGRHV